MRPPPPGGRNRPLPGWLGDDAAGQVREIEIEVKRGGVGIEGRGIRRDEGRLQVRCRVPGQIRRLGSRFEIHSERGGLGLEPQRRRVDHRGVQIRSRRFRRLEIEIRKLEIEGARHLLEALLRRRRCSRNLPRLQNRCRREFRLADVEIESQALVLRFAHLRSVLGAVERCHRSRLRFVKAEVEIDHSAV